MQISPVTGQLWSIATTTIQVRLRIQLNSILFVKTLVRKDVASSSPPTTTKIGDNDAESIAGSEKNQGETDFSSKAQIMTLMTTDVDRVSDFAWHAFSLVGKSNQLDQVYCVLTAFSSRCPDRNNHWNDVSV